MVNAARIGPLLFAGVSLLALSGCVPDAEPFVDESDAPSVEPAGCELGETRRIFEGKTDLSAFVRGSDGAVLLAHLPPAGAGGQLHLEQREGELPTPCNDYGHLALGDGSFSLKGRELLLACGGRADAPATTRVLDALPSSDDDLTCSCGSGDPNACERWLWLWTPHTCAESFERLGPPAGTGARALTSRVIAPSGPTSGRAEALCSWEPEWEGGPRAYTLILGYKRTRKPPPITRGAHYDDGLEAARHYRGYLYATYARGWPASEKFSRLRFRCGENPDDTETARLDVESTRPEVADYLTGAIEDPPRSENSYVDLAPGQSWVARNSQFWGTTSFPLGHAGTGRWGDLASAHFAEDRIAVRPIYIAPGVVEGQGANDGSFSVAEGASQCDVGLEDDLGFWEVWLR